MSINGQTTIQDILPLVLGGIFAVVTIILAHFGSWYGLITFILTCLTWLISFSSAVVIAIIFAIGGLVELLIFGKIFLGVLFLILFILTLLFQD